MNYLVSVIVPTKNSSKFLDACLESVINQEYKNIELIVIDNNSTDYTKEIAAKYTDKVFNLGPERSAQRNFGVAKAEGNFVFIIDSDMVLSRRVVSDCVETVRANPELKALIVPEESFGKGFWAQCKKLERSFYIGIDWMEAARFFDRKIYLEADGYDESLVSGEDWDLSQRVKTNNKVGRINSLIYHNEGNLRLWSLLKKKIYYARLIKNYTNKQTDDKSVGMQVNLLHRYLLFFKDPAKLFRNPTLGLGMLFMKTCEFVAGGLGMLIPKT